MKKKKCLAIIMAHSNSLNFDHITTPPKLLGNGIGCLWSLKCVQPVGLWPLSCFKLSKELHWHRHYVGLKPFFLDSFQE